MIMKKIIGYTFLACLSFAISSCEDDNFATLNSSASLDPSASKTDVVLNKDAVGTDVLSISWPAPEYGAQVSPTYFIYLDKEDGDFSAPVMINNAGALSKTFKSEELNKNLIALKFTPGVAAKLKYKVEAKLGTFRSVMSDVQEINATAYTSFLDLSTTWGVVGSGYNNWGDFPDAPFYATSATNELVAYVTLVTGDIKFRQNNAWDMNLGDNGADGTLEKDGANIAVTAGTYKITMNPVTLTYKIAKFSWGIVGDAYNNWGSDGPDFPFTYDDATDQWRAIVPLKTGAFKIRKNNDWGENYGDTGADGKLDSGGDNINITAGKYLVTFNEHDLTYKIESIPNIWGLVGSAYNNWGADGPDAEFNRDWRNDGVWILKNVKLLAGDYKFRDNNDWGTNYGDNGGDGTLEKDGSNITTTGGIYTITLDFSNPNSPTWKGVKVHD
jgi:hypothetical protein